MHIRIWQVVWSTQLHTNWMVHTYTMESDARKFFAMVEAHGDKVLLLDGVSKVAKMVNIKPGDIEPMDPPPWED